MSDSGSYEEERSQRPGRLEAENAQLRAEVAELQALLEDRSIRSRLLLDGRSGYVLVDRNGYAPIDSVLYQTPREAVAAAIEAAKGEKNGQG